MNILSATSVNSVALKRITLIAVFLISVFCLLLWERTVVSLSDSSARFQEWSSDTMWQCLESPGLREHPFKSLWYLHKEPPLYDAIRTVLLIGLQKMPDQALSKKLDQRIYIFWAVCFGLMAVLICLWLSRLTSLRYAFYLSMAWILHPAPIYYATYLDPTMLVSLGALWFFYELWLLYCKEGSITRLLASVIILFYLRATFSWFFLILLTGCLVLMRISRKSLIKFMVICALLTTPYLAKQYFTFKVPEITILGSHLYFLVAGDTPPSEGELGRIASSIPWTYPKDAALSVGVWNTEDDWRKNFAYRKLAGQYVRAHPFESLKNIARTFFVHNWPQYWRPSSAFSPNRAVSLLPWNDAFNQYLSYPVNVWILVLALLLWRVKRKYAGLPLIDRGALGIFLLLFYLFLTSTLVNANGKGWTEAVRYKFFLEPIFYVFIAGQFYIMLAAPDKNKTRGASEEHK